MIRFANDTTAHSVRSMWKICFGDTEEFMNLYFTQKYRNYNTLIYFEKNKPVASLQMLPYNIRFYGEIIPLYYLAGLCTLPEFRNKGYMGKLIKRSFEVMQDRSIPLAILIPAEDWLFTYYAKYGFETTFEKSDENINLKKILEDNENNTLNAFQKFDLEFQQQDFCVLKSEEDFGSIIQDYVNEGYPLKSNLAGMSAIVDTERLLRLYAQKNQFKNFGIKLHDAIFNKINYYVIENGSVTKGRLAKCEKEIEVTSQMLIRLLFGFKTYELSDQYSSLFEKHNPIMNLMLE